MVARARWYHHLLNPQVVRERKGNFQQMKGIKEADYLHAALTDAAAACEAGEAESSADPVQATLLTPAHRAQLVGGPSQAAKDAQAGMITRPPQPEDAGQSHLLQHHRPCRVRPCRTSFRALHHGILSNLMVPHTSQISKLQAAGLYKASTFLRPCEMRASSGQHSGHACQNLDISG